MRSLITVGIFDPEVVEYALKLEFGDKGTSFMRSAYDSQSSAIGDYIVEQYDKVLSKKLSIEKARKNVGDYIVTLIKDMIIKKGLIKTGSMLNSVEAKYDN